MQVCRAVAAFVIGTSLVAGVDASPVAHWRFDDPAGSTTVLDSAGSNHGSLVGNPLLGAEGVMSGAIDLDGVGDGVNVGASNVLKPTDDFTVTFWFQPDDLSNFEFQRIIDATSNSSNIQDGYRVLLHNDNGDRKLRWLVRGSNNNGQVVESTPLQAGQWYFGAVSYDKDSDIRVSVYDRETATLSMNTNSAGSTGAIDYGANTHDVYLGRSVGSNEFDAHLDDLAIWNSVLSSGETDYVRRHGAAAPLPHLSWNGKDPAVSDGSKDEWLPQVGSGYHWDLESAPDRVAVTSSRGGINHAYRYSGDESVVFSNDAESDSSFAPFDNSADASFEAWFRLGDADGSGSVLDDGKRVVWETGGYNGASITINNNQLRFGTASGGLNSGQEVEVLLDLATLSSDTLSEFLQVVGVFDKTNGQTLLYLNGELISHENSTTGNWSGVNPSGLGTKASSTGGFLDNGPDYQNFVGDIAIFNYYQSALTDEQIAAAYQGVAVPEPGTIASVLLIAAAANRRRG